MGMPLLMNQHLTYIYIFHNMYRLEALTNKGGVYYWKEITQQFFSCLD